MEEKEIIEINKNGWNELVKSGKNFSNTSLPEYGPFMRNEEYFNIFKDVKNKRVLELGCAKGESLKYLQAKGASEIWGIDISEEQLKYAKNNLPSGKFFVSAMENNPGIPENYFDYCLSLYSIGFSSSLEKTLALVSKYLKKDGKFVFCWTHPFFNCLVIDEDKVVIGKSYNDEALTNITKGEDKIPMVQYNFKISTIINAMIKSGLTIEKMIEDKPIQENHIGNYKSNFWDKRIDQSDFLVTRLGIGQEHLDVKIEYPDEGFTVDEDELRKQADRLVAEFQYISNVPIGYSFYQNKLQQMSDNGGVIATIRLGLLTDNPFLANVGPKINLKYKTISAITSTVEENIENYGVNHVMVSLKIVIKIRLMVLFPFYNEEFSHKYDYPLVMEVIEGEVPNWYQN